MVAFLEQNYLRVKHQICIWEINHVNLGVGFFFGWGELCRTVDENSAVSAKKNLGDFFFFGELEMIFMTLRLFFF